MRIIITEEMRFRQKVVEYAIKHKNNVKVAIRYDTSRQVQRWRKKYNETVESLANKSIRPHSHPNEYTQKEIELISKKYQYHKHEGLGQVYRKCKESGYKRSYGSMCKQIRKQKSYEKAKRISYPKSKYKALKGTYPGEYVEIDVKYVPNECIGFKVKVVQTDNEREFCNDREEKKSAFEKELEKLGIEYKRTRPYSPWQNGVVERSHKMDNEIFYSKRRFRSEKEMYKAFQRYSVRTNNISRKVLGFKTPNEMVEEYLKGAV